MANEVEICNLALSRVVAQGIQNLNDASREAQACRRHYTFCRDSVLEDYDWPFARREVALAELSITQSGWDFVFVLPTNCIAPRRIFNADDPKGADPTKRIAYERRLHPTESTGILCCDIEAPVLIYTSQVTSASSFDPMFVDLLAWRLASEFALTLRGSAQLMQRMFQVYTSVLNTASARSINQGYVEPSGFGALAAIRQ